MENLEFPISCFHALFLGLLVSPVTSILRRIQNRIIHPSLNSASASPSSKISVLSHQRDVVPHCIALVTFFLYFIIFQRFIYIRHPHQCAMLQLLKGHREHLIFLKLWGWVTKHPLLWKLKTVTCVVVSIISIDRGEIFKWFPPVLKLSFQINPSVSLSNRKMQERMNTPRVLKKIGLLPNKLLILLLIMNCTDVHMF